ncbi:hypothetical protein F4774DRAFT_48107 [Daldinia eschscholtzii]|nr:hypothetical protein F4774DRAFT_48107 [Daldinia eschscholtzii]
MCKMWTWLAVLVTIFLPCAYPSSPPKSLSLLLNSNTNKQTRELLILICMENRCGKSNKLKSIRQYMASCCSHHASALQASFFPY